MGMGRVVVAAALLAGGAAAETPEQFRAWGTRGPGFPPAPAGWKELPGEEPPSRPATPSARDRSRGFIVFRRKAFEEVYPDTIPAGHEAGAELRAFAARGEYEPMTFALHALEDLAGCRVEPGVWASPAGATFPADHVDVRLVRPIRSKVRYSSPADRRFRRAPFLLEKSGAFDVKAGRTAQIWLTVKVPDDAEAAVYRGSVTVRAAGRESAEIPVALRVLPFRLPPVPIETVMSYPRPARDPAIREREMIDQREHGINNVEAGAGARVVSRDRDFGEDDAAATRESIREALALRRKVFGRDAARWPVTAEVGHQILYHWNRGKGWFDYWPRSAKMEADFLEAIRLVEETVRAAGPFGLRIFVMDEPGGNPTLKETTYYNRLVKERFPHLRTWCTIGGGMSMGIDEIGILGPYVDEFTTNRFTPDVCRTLLDRKEPYGVYNGGSSSEAVGGFARDRYFFGFYCWRTGAREILQWVYAFGDPWNAPLRGNHGYVYPAPDGPLPSIPWEGVREGIDDYRYMDLLRRLVTRARASGDAGAARAAKAAEELTSRIMSSVGLGYQGLTSRTPPASPGQMERWRWLVASAVLELARDVPIEAAAGAPLAGEKPVRPGPFDIPFPEDALAPTGFGPELLPSGGFEDGPGPWKVSGRGTGGIDETHAHGGAKSFKLVNALDSDASAVTVCVWGWGGGGPTMTLAAGKTYDFSAWVRGGSPSLRISLPAGAAGRQEDGPVEVGPGGWRRISRRVTMARDGRPGYLAVWLQGPGTVWCDELSMREVELPPFAVDVPQTIADGSDRMLRARIRRAGGTGAIRVRVRLPGVAEPRTVTVPQGGEAVVEFPGSALAVGEHELTAEFAEPGGRAFSRSVVIRRVRGPIEE